MAVLGCLGEVFVLVASVSEGADGVDVEGVFSHADDVCACFSEFDVCLLVDALGVGLDLCADGLFEVCAFSLEASGHFLAYLQVFALVEGEDGAAPLPLEFALALVLWLVEEAARADLVVDDGDGLEPIGEDDIGVHGRHVDVVDQRQRLVLVRRAHVPQPRQPPPHLLPHRLQVDGVLQALLGHLHLHCEPQDILHALHELLECGGLEGEVGGEVGAVDAGAQALHLPAGVGLRVQQVPLVVLVDVLHLLVGEDDGALVGLGHQEVLAEGAAALAEHFVWEHGDDGGEGEDEPVDVLQVEEVGGHGVGDGVLGQPLRVVLGQPHHLLGVHLDGVVVELGLRHCLQSPRSLRQEGVALDPAEAVEVGHVAAVVLAALFGDAQLCGEAEGVEFHAALQVGVVELIAVVGGHDVRVVVLQEGCELRQQPPLGWLVEDGDVTGELWLGLVVEGGDWLPAEAGVDDEEGLALVHQADHHDLVLLCVWELEWVLGGLDVEGEDLELGHAPLLAHCAHAHHHLILQLHVEPLSRAQARVDADAGVEGDVELADGGDEVGDFACLVGFVGEEGVVVLEGAFATFFEERLEGVLGVGEVAHGAEQHLEVALAPPREVVRLLQVHLLLQLNRLHLLQFRLQVRLHFLLRPVCVADVEVGSVGEQALDEFPVLALEEAEDGHAFLVVVHAVAVGLGLEVGEEAQEAALALAEPHAHLLLELLALVPRLVLHFPPILLCAPATTPKPTLPSAQGRRSLKSGSRTAWRASSSIRGWPSCYGSGARWRPSAQVGVAVRRQSAGDAGLSNSSKNHAQFLEPPFLIDKYAAWLLHSRPETLGTEGVRFSFASQAARQGLLEVGESREAAIYLHLAGKYFLMDGHKFGCAFLLYEADPDLHHAKAMVFVGEQEEHVSRLAGIAKKEAWMAELTPTGVTITVAEKHRSRRFEQRA